MVPLPSQAGLEQKKILLTGQVNMGKLRRDETQTPLCHTLGLLSVFAGQPDKLYALSTPATQITINSDGSCVSPIL